MGKDESRHQDAGNRAPPPIHPSTISSLSTSSPFIIIIIIITDTCMLDNSVSVEQRDVNMRRALVLHALPVYLREDASKFFRTCNSADGPDLTDTPVALLTVVTDDTTDAALLSPESICIVVED
ncbi:hypothetical protein GBF38_021123 [Nibea albiflora]|uniref:Uncharacterized protein n=1 Tax=Nibea albiflora TaxID=240163 RepID=A0ACB7FFP6_NIBAL|nr:hypothetical protein GBF38_021123 [Nibea albiflora]